MALLAASVVSCSNDDPEVFRRIGVYGKYHVRSVDYNPSFAIMNGHGLGHFALTKHRGVEQW